MKTHNWTLNGAEGETILVSSDCATDDGGIRANVIFAHGFKGYKDYGFIPVLSAQLANALPIVVHRFNFSHSGMTDDVSTFARPDLFEKDTWNKQVFDLSAMLRAVATGEAPGSAADVPIILMGHSRGGSACLLTAGRRFRDGVSPQPTGVITIAAPDSTCNLSPDAIEMFETEGAIVSPSVRTGQSLRVDSAWLTEQRDEPENHDLIELCTQILCPVFVAHGADDPTVPAESAERIARACPIAETLILPETNHIMNTVNPADPDAALSPALKTLVDHTIRFISDVAIPSSS